jgi:hypothetical protein
MLNQSQAADVQKAKDLIKAVIKQQSQGLSRILEDIKYGKVEVDDEVIKHIGELMTDVTSLTSIIAKISSMEASLPIDFDYLIKPILDNIRSNKK